MANPSETSDEQNKAGQSSSGSYLVENNNEQTKKRKILEDLFSNGNKLLTLPGSDISISDETRRLVALFSDGTYLVSKDHRFDGPVYNFEKTIKKRKIPIKAAEYVSQNEICRTWLRCR